MLKKNIVFYKLTIVASSNDVKKVPNFQGIFLIIFLLEKYQLRRSFFVRSVFLICNSLIVKRSPFLMTLHYINSRSTIGFYKHIGFWPKIYLIFYPALPWKLDNLYYHTHDNNQSFLRFISRSEHNFLFDFPQTWRLNALSMHADQSAHCGQMLSKIAQLLKVSKSRKQFTVSSILPKTERWDNFM